MRYYLCIILLFLFCSSCRNEEDKTSGSDTPYFTAIAENDIRLPVPKEGDWLYEHKEKGQTFRQYRRQKPLRPNDTQNIIYLKPIGRFTPLQQKALESTRTYVQLFFQTETVLLPEAGDESIPLKYRRLREDGNEQIFAPYILDSVLKVRTPKNSIACMAFTARDLYHQDDWNFVFGLASYSQRVGVTSIYRFGNEQPDTAGFGQTLRRLINVSSHEIGHMFGLKHCTFARCVMNGSNSLSEADLAPNRLCSQCQKKLHWNIKYDNRKRLNELVNFFEANNLKQDHDYLKTDLKRVP